MYTDAVQDVYAQTSKRAKTGMHERTCQHDNPFLHAKLSRVVVVGVFYVTKVEHRLQHPLQQVGMRTSHMSVRRKKFGGGRTPPRHNDHGSARFCRMLRLLSRWLLNFGPKFPHGNIPGYLCLTPQWCNGLIWLGHSLSEDVVKQVGC